MSSISIEVIEHNIFPDSDPNYYNNHYFTCQVWLEQEMYQINRTYDSFCELDIKFKKQYSRSKLPNLPLNGLNLFVKKSKSKILQSNNNNNNNDEIRSSMMIIDPRGSVLGGSPMIITGDPWSAPQSNNNVNDKKAKQNMVKRVDFNEVIGQKKALLNNYLRELLKIPEIIVSETLLSFLDAESVNGSEIIEPDESQEQYAELYVLLTGEEFTTKTVVRSFKIDIGIEADQVIIWNFKTKNRDVGFSVKYNDCEVLTYQRYNSHERNVLGSLAALESGKLELLWDNTYSKIRSKQLSYMYKVVNKEDFELAKIIISDIKKEKSKYNKLRLLLKRILSQLSANALVRKSQERSPSTSGMLSHQAAAIAAVSVIVSSTSSNSHADLDNINSFHHNSHNIDNDNDNDHNNNLVLSSNMDYEEAMHEINKLKNEKKTLQQALMESESALVAERTVSAKYIQYSDDLLVTKESLEEELYSVKNENEILKQDLIDLSNENINEDNSTTTNNNNNNKLDNNIIENNDDDNNINNQVEKQLLLSIDYILDNNNITVDFREVSSLSKIYDKELIYEAFSVLHSHTCQLQHKLQTSESLKTHLDTQNNKLKAEKKQLKSYALQLKDKNQELENNLIGKEHELSLLSQEYQILKSIQNNNSNNNIDEINDTIIIAKTSHIPFVDDESSPSVTHNKKAIIITSDEINDALSIKMTHADNNNNGSKSPARSGSSKIVTLFSSNNSTKEKSPKANGENSNSNNGGIMVKPTFPSLNEIDDLFGVGIGKMISETINDAISGEGDIVYPHKPVPLIPINSFDHADNNTNNNNNNDSEPTPESLFSFKLPFTDDISAPIHDHTSEDDNNNALSISISQVTAGATSSLSSMKSSLFEMMPTWDSLLSIIEDDTNNSNGNSPNSNNNSLNNTTNHSTSSRARSASNNNDYNSSSSLFGF
eukprot:gene7411-10102_t